MLLDSQEKRRLVVENGQALSGHEEPLDDSANVQFEVLKDTATEYEFALSATGAAWFFIADVYYPGWKVFLDGVEAQVYPAKVMGKAVYLPAGIKKLTLKYDPLSFKAGLVVTLCSIFALLALLAVSHRGSVLHSRGQTP